MGGGRRGRYCTSSLAMKRLNQIELAILGCFYNFRDLLFRIETREWACIACCLSAMQAIGKLIKMLRLGSAIHGTICLISCKVTNIPKICQDAVTFCP